jgi:hypothetical protein
LGKKKREKNRRLKKKLKLPKKQQTGFSELYPESDETYAYIAGYTNWGFAFGVTWEEMERYADQDSLDELAPPNKRMTLRCDPDEKHQPFDYRAVDDAEEVPFDQAEFHSNLQEEFEKEEEF